jgi:hypothetical protein
MIKFFRKIRQNLLSEGKSGKYLKYAVGEIILVVIGILIAVQLNDFNEKKNSQNELDQLLIDLTEFMESQKVLINFELTNIKQKDSILNNLIQNQLKETFSLNPDQIRQALFDPTKFPYHPIPEYQMDFSNINNLINRKEDFPKAYWSMIYDLESLKMYSNAIVFLSSKLSELSKNHLDFLLNKRPHYFESNPTSDKALMDYIMNDPNFEIRISEIKEYQEEIIDAYERYMFNSAKLEATINHHINDYNAQQIDSLWLEYDAIKFLTENCKNNTEYKFTSVLNSRGRLLVYNAQEKKVQIQLYNKNNEVLKDITYSKKGVFTFNLLKTEDKVGLRYKIGENCYNITNPVKNGYFLIK